MTTNGLFVSSFHFNANFTSTEVLTFLFIYVFMYIKKMYFNVLNRTIKQKNMKEKSVLQNTFLDIYTPLVS